MGEQLGGKAAVSVVVSGKTVGRATGGDLYGDLWQRSCAEVASGNAAVWVEFVVTMGLLGHWGVLSIEI